MRRGSLIVAVALGLALGACGPRFAGTRLFIETNEFQLVPGECDQVVAAPVRIVREGDAMVFVDIGTDVRRTFVWPFGFAAWVEDEVAVLYASDGLRVGREGDILDDLGGREGSSEFYVCAIGVRTYS